MQSKRRYEVIRLQATDKEFQKKQDDITSIEKEITATVKELKKANFTLGGKKAKYQIDKEDLASKTKSGANQRQIKEAESAMKDSEEDMMWAQKSQLKFLGIISDLKLRLEKVKASIDSPIRPILVHTGKIEKLEQSFL